MIARLKLEVSDEERAELMKRARSRTIPSRDRFRAQIVLCRADGLSKAETANKLDFYTHDGNKNVSELVFFQQANGIAAHYEYAPFGAVAAASRSTPVTAIDFCGCNPFRFSSEYADTVQQLVYYNFRHYNHLHGRWTTRDLLDDKHCTNLHSWCVNNGISGYDQLGLAHIETRPLDAGENNFLQKINNGVSLINLPGNIDPRHKEIFFDDECADCLKSADYGPQGVHSDTSNIRYNQREKENYDDEIMWEAVQKVALKPEWQGKKYGFVTHNCQDFVAAVIKEYKEIENLKNNDRCKKCN